MNYFKNTDLAARYHISESTVRNWVKLSLEGKLDLDLAQAKGKNYVANNARNIAIVDKLVEENKKYRTRKSAKVVTPRPEFRVVFSPGQAYDIVRNLELYHEIPRQYNYFDGGAHKWDDYVVDLSRQHVPNLLNRTTSLLADSQAYLEKRIAEHKTVNVIDVGVGNAMPVRDFLQDLHNKGVLNRYIAMDISRDMLDIAEENIKQWFGDKVAFEGYQTDVTYERFANLLAEDYLGKDAINLVLLLGGTADNLRNPDDVFRTIIESMNPNDLLIYTNKLETPEMRPQWFDHAIKPGKLTLAPIHRLVFDLLNIDESFYDVETGFDSVTRQRYARARLKVALTLKFDFDEGERNLSFEKGDAILLWRSWQMSADDVSEQFKRSGFYTLYSTQTDDHEYLLSIAEIRRSK